jgi:hypothetical protein
MFAIALGRVVEERLPARTWTAIRIHNSVEKPNSNCVNALPITSIIKTGLRLIRYAPQIGEKMNARLQRFFAFPGFDCIHLVLLR